MPYEIATESEIEIAQTRCEPFPWAAGEPGTLFDKPGDILWSNGGYDGRAFKDWAKENNVPTSMSYSERSTAKVEGWHILTFQKGVQISIQRDDPSFDELFRILDIVIPEKLPVVIRIGRIQNGSDKWVKGLHFNLFEPSLSEYASFSIFYSGDTWMVLRTRYSTATMEFEDTDRNSFFGKVRARFGWSNDSNDDDDDDDGY